MGFSVLQVTDGHWIHVMNIEPTVDLEAGHAQVTTLITNDDLVSNASPLSGRVELLVHVSVEAEGLVSNNSSEREILKALFEVGDSTKL